MRSPRSSLPSGERMPRAFGRCSPGQKSWEGSFSPGRSITFSATRTSTRRIFSLATTDRFISSIGMGRSSLPENEICSSSSARESRESSSPGKRNSSSRGTDRSDIDPEALIYYRYERIVEDLGEIGRSVLLDPNPSDQMRTEESRLAQKLLRAGRRHRPCRGSDPTESRRSANKAVHGSLSVNGRSLAREKPGATRASSRAGDCLQHRPRRRSESRILCTTR